MSVFAMVKLVVQNALEGHPIRYFATVSGVITIDILASVQTSNPTPSPYRENW